MADQFQIISSSGIEGLMNVFKFTSYNVMWSLISALLSDDYSHSDR